MLTEHRRFFITADMNENTTEKMPVLSKLPLPGKRVKYSRMRGFEMCKGIQVGESYTFEDMRVGRSFRSWLIYHGMDAVQIKQGAHVRIGRIA